MTTVHSFDHIHRLRASTPRMDELEARLRFLRPNITRPVVHVQDIASGKTTGLPPDCYEERRVPIDNGRSKALSLEREGVILIPHRSRVVDWFDPEEVESVYTGEVAELVRIQTGAREVLVFDKTVRAQSPGLRNAMQLREPVSYVHADYTETSGPQRVRDLSGLLADERLARPFAFYNLWRPLNGPVESRPLAYIDASSLNPDTLVETDLVYTDRIGHIYNQIHDPQHRWLTFPGQDTREVALFKTFDSRKQRIARFVTHGAFEDPDASPASRERTSLEVRTIAFF
ncbi:MAG: CmcJ/NvfI family oxidoreductase [Myxococcota bacterium]